MRAIVKESTPDTMGKTIALENEGGVDKKILCFILRQQDKEIDKEFAYNKAHTCPRCALVIPTGQKECDCESYIPRRVTKVKKILVEMTAPPKSVASLPLNNWAK